VFHVRVDHDPQRRMLQMHELRDDERLRMSDVRINGSDVGSALARGSPAKTDTQSSFECSKSIG
jgi:hypothetical protein